MFIASAVVTAAIAEWAHYLSASARPTALSPIFFRLFAVDDQAGALALLGVVLLAAGAPARDRTRSLLDWLGAHPLAVAIASAAVLCCGAWLVYLAKPLCMDEYAPVFQSQIFAAGRLSGQFPPALLDWLVPHGFQNYFLNVSRVSGRIASAYWPSFALLLTPFTWLGIPWACNPLISGLTVLAVHRLALRIFEDRQAAGLAVLFTIASPVFFADGISFYSMSAHLLANTVYGLLLLAPTARRALCAGLVGSVALTLHNPVPHILFAIPWIVALLRRPGGLRLTGYLCAGYVPLCLLLGVGWFSFSSGLTHAGVASAGDSVTRIGSAFALPSSGLWLARSIGVAKLWCWAVPGLVLLCAVGAARWRHHPGCLLLTASALLTLVGYLFVPFDQGHGWGYRYFASAWMVLPILAAGALTPGPHSPERGGHMWWSPEPRTFVVACALLTLVGGVGFRALQMHAFIAAHWSHQPGPLGGGRQLVIIDASSSFYAADLVQNDPWLRGNVIRMVSHGPDADAAMMHAEFPGMSRRSTDRFGSVWSSAAAAGND